MCGWRTCVSSLTVLLNWNLGMKMMVGGQPKKLHDDPRQHLVSTVASCMITLGRAPRVRPQALLKSIHLESNDQWCRHVSWCLAGQMDILCW